MKIVISQFAILAMAKTVFGQCSCSLCPDGITFPDKVVDGASVTCKEAEQGLIQIGTPPRDCIIHRIGYAPCCPEQENIRFADNACGWCPNGIDSGDILVEDPFDSSSYVNCSEISQYTAAMAGVCHYFEPSQSTCCPGNEGKMRLGCPLCEVEFSDSLSYLDFTCYELGMGSQCCPGEGSVGDSGGGDDGEDTFCDAGHTIDAGLLATALALFTFLLF
eukprot:scaffold23464_cov126-Cylindrotheca_fusiformis.AAC.12